MVDQAEGRGRRDAPVAAVPFPDRLAALVEERRSQIVLGLDPDPSRLWQVAVGAESVDEAVTAHCRAVIELSLIHI